MKRIGNLWARMVSFESLLAAAGAAARGKRFKPGAARFLFHLEPELLRLQHELTTKTYLPGPYRVFTIYEGKKRQISAAPFRDRVVHHALTCILEPIFERSFIFDSYACRKGKGAHAAVDRCQQFARRYRYVLKADVRKFFPSIDHQILKTRRLHQVRSEVERFLESLRLQIHQNKSVVFPSDQGIRFLGYRVFPTHRLLAGENVRRFRRRMRWMQRAFAAGQIGFDAIRPRIMSWIGHARHANTYRLRTDIFRRMTFQRAAAKPSSAPGRDVQQSTGERLLGEP